MMPSWLQLPVTPNLKMTEKIASHNREGSRHSNVLPDTTEPAPAGGFSTGGLVFFSFFPAAISARNPPRPPPAPRVRFWAEKTRSVRFNVDLHQAQLQKKISHRLRRPLELRPRQEPPPQVQEQEQAQQARGLGQVSPEVCPTMSRWSWH